MAFNRQSAALAVGLAVIVLCPVSAFAQSQEWASAEALGDVFQGTGAQVKVFGHGGQPKGVVTLPSNSGSVRSLALDASSNLFVATDGGTIYRVSHATGHAITTVLQGLSPDIRSLAFDEADSLYVGYGGLQPMIERYDGPAYALPSVIHRVSCDATPAAGLWFDVTPQTLSTPAKRFAVYTCGTREVRYVDLLATSLYPSMNTPSALLTTLPSLPGNDESARDIRLLAPVASDPLPSDAALDTILGVQGGMVVAYGTNVQWLTRAGTVVSTFDFGSGGNALNAWCCLALSPTGGAIWAGDANNAVLRRFRLATGVPQPQQAVNSGTPVVAALAVNGDPRLAQSTHFVSMTSGAPAVATFLAGTQWAHDISFTAVPDPSSPPPSLPVRLAVTSFETRSGGPFPDLNVDGRFVAGFPGTTAVSASRGRSNFYRAVRQSQQPYSEPHETVVTVEYNLPTSPSGFLSGLYKDGDHTDRGFVQPSGAIDQFDVNMRTEWFQTNEIIRGGTLRCCSDFVVAAQAAPPTTFSTFSSSVQLGASVPIRVDFPFAVTAQFCAELVLTVARPPTTIVGSSLTTLNHNGEGAPYFTPLGFRRCGANLDVTPNSSEVPGEIDFAAGRTYNVCVVKQLAPGQPPVADVCGQMNVK